MKLTKFAHSCVLVETAERVGLFDPGNYSWEHGSFNIAKLTRLDDILITHEHADHMHLPFIQALLATFPNAAITTTEPAARQLQEHGITNVRTVTSDGIALFQAAHETLEPLGQPPANTGIHYLDMFSHPGDSHRFGECKTVLAVPITAPWGTTMRAASIIQELKPKYVLPVHDWLWRDEIRQKFYDRIAAFCQELDVNFIAAADGVATEISN